jgi:hypothetical protein
MPQRRQARRSLAIGRPRGGTHCRCVVVLACDLRRHGRPRRLETASYKSRRRDPGEITFESGRVPVTISISCGFIAEQVLIDDVEN